MSEFNYLTDRLAAQQIRERVADRQRSGLVGSRRRSGRHALASSLHGLAKRIDS